MMYTIGVDFHKRSSTFHVLDVEGNKVMNKKIENTPENLTEFLDSLPQGYKRLALEATRSWALFHDTVAPLVDEVLLGHPKKMKAITSSEAKNDNNDAKLIAQLTHSKFLPKAHISSPDIRELRQLTRFRASLVGQRKAIRNMVQALIDRHIWPSDRPKSFKDPFCSRGREWLQRVELPEKERFILDRCLKLFDELSINIDEIKEFASEYACSLPGWKFIRTVPGFRTGGINAVIVLAEVSNIDRFSKARSFARYAGLMPKERSSGDKQRMGRLVKGASMSLRTALIESTLAAIRTDCGLKAYYKQVKQRCGSSAAIVATARKLSYAIYHVLKQQRTYEPEPLRIYPPAADCHPQASNRV